MGTIDHQNSDARIFLPGWTFEDTLPPQKDIYRNMLNMFYK
jgi:hypothetical protein